MASAMRETQKYNTARAGKIRDAAGRSRKCGREKPPAAKPSVNEREKPDWLVFLEPVRF